MLSTIFTVLRHIPVGYQLDEGNDKKSACDKNIEEREVSIPFGLLLVVIKFLPALSEDVGQECGQEDAAGEAVEVAQDPLAALSRGSGVRSLDHDQVRDQTEHHGQDEQQNGRQNLGQHKVHADWYSLPNYSLAFKKN